MKTDLSITGDRSGLFDAEKSFIEIENDFITYRITFNADKLEISKLTANGLDTIVITPSTSNKIILS